MSGHVNSLFMHPDPVKEVNFQVTNHSSSLKLRWTCPALPGRILCTGLYGNNTGEVSAAGGLKRLRRSAGRGRAEMGCELRSSCDWHSPLQIVFSHLASHFIIS